MIIELNWNWSNIRVDQYTITIDKGENYGVKVFAIEEMPAALIELFGSEDAVSIATQIRQAAIREANDAKETWRATDMFKNLQVVLGRIADAQTLVDNLEREFEEQPDHVNMKQTVDWSNRIDQLFRRTAIRAHEQTGKKGKDLSPDISSIAKSVRYDIVKGQETEAMNWALAQYESGAKDLVIIDKPTLNKLLKSGGFTELPFFEAKTDITVRLVTKDEG